MDTLSSFEMKDKAKRKRPSRCNKRGEPKSRKASSRGQPVQAPRCTSTVYSGQHEIHSTRTGPWLEVSQRCSSRAFLLARPYAFYKGGRADKKEGGCPSSSRRSCQEKFACSVWLVLAMVCSLVDLFPPIIHYGLRFSCACEVISDRRCSSG